MERQLRETKEELAVLKEHDGKLGKDNERLVSDSNEFKMQLERLAFENKEAQITMDGLKDANSELTAELDEVKQQMLDMKMSAKETSAVLDEKEKKKAERMAQMMAGFDLSGDVFSDNERSVADAIAQLDALYEISSTGDPIPPDDIKALRERLVEAQGIVRQAELSTFSATSNETETRKRTELEARLAELQQEHEDILSRNLDEADKEEVKALLAKTLSDKSSTQVELVEDLKADLTLRTSENERLKALVEDLQRRVKSNGAVPMANGKTVQQQLAEFDVMKKSLMRDLQNRCERVVELEISLDETREQYNNVLRSSNNRAQQKKMAFLERNLEQLTQVQRQLVEQNSALKKEVAIAERKLIARNERIQSLESLLQESQEKMAAANHKYVFLPIYLPIYLPSRSLLTLLSTGSKSSSRPSKTVSRRPRPGAHAASAHRLVSASAAALPSPSAEVASLPPLPTLPLRTSRTHPRIRDRVGSSRSRRWVCQGRNLSASARIVEVELEAETEAECELYPLFTRFLFAHPFSDPLVLFVRYIGGRGRKTGVVSMRNRHYKFMLT
jgi:hypothetical protein